MTRPRTRRLMPALISVLILATAFPPDAFAMRRGDNAVVQSRERLKAEWAQSRRSGGYPDPITALGQLFRGEDRARIVQPPIFNPPQPKIWDNFD